MHHVPDGKAVARNGDGLPRQRKAVVPISPTVNRKVAHGQYGTRARRRSSDRVPAGNASNLRLHTGQRRWRRSCEQPGHHPGALPARSSSDRKRGDPSSLVTPDCSKASRSDGARQAPALARLATFNRWACDHCRPSDCRPDKEGRTFILAASMSRQCRVS